MTPRQKNPPKRPASRPAQKPQPKQTEKKAEKVEKVDEAKVEAANFEAEIKHLKDRLLRAMAEMENTRRRAEREAQDARAYAITGFAREMLTVQDNLRLTLTHLPEEMKENDTHKAFVEGVEVTERELLNIFDRHGIKRISPKGEEFDHNFHQAMFEVETTEHEPGTIMEVIQDGYVIRDRLLRPAMVGIAKAPKKEPEKEENSGE
ncbi:MAG: nucleotide exchange factor GrpE [Sphingomonadales bacterium]